MSPQTHPHPPPPLPLYSLYLANILINIHLKTGSLNHNLAIIRTRGMKLYSIILFYIFKMFYFLFNSTPAPPPTPQPLPLARLELKLRILNNMMISLRCFKVNYFGCGMLKVCVASAWNLCGRSNWHSQLEYETRPREYRKFCLPPTKTIYEIFHFAKLLAF